MKNKSDTNLLRHYCNLNKGSFLDVGSVHYEHFRDISESVFRKYVSRLSKEGMIQPVSKGLFYIGRQLPEDLDSRILTFFNAKNIHFGESLLFELGIIETKPEYECLRCFYGNKNRHVRGFYFWPIRFTSGLAPKYLFELFDLIDQFEKIPEESMAKYLEEVGTRLSKLNEFDLKHMDVEYKRGVYSKLDNMLKSLHKSTEVMQWYERRKRISH